MHLTSYFGGICYVHLDVTAFLVDFLAWGLSVKIILNFSMEIASDLVKNICNVCILYGRDTHMLVMIFVIYFFYLIINF